MLLLELSRLGAHFDMDGRQFHNVAPIYEKTFDIKRILILIFIFICICILIFSFVF